MLQDPLKRNIAFLLLGVAWSMTGVDLQKNARGRKWSMRVKRKLKEHCHLSLGINSSGQNRFLTWRSQSQLFAISTSWINSVLFIYITKRFWRGHFIQGWIIKIQQQLQYGTKGIPLVFWDIFHPLFKVQREWKWSGKSEYIVHVTRKV